MQKSDIIYIMVSFLQSSLAFFSNVITASILSFFALEGERIGIFEHHFEGQNALLDVWEVETYMSNIPKTRMWFGSTFKKTSKTEIHRGDKGDETTNMCFSPWMPPGVILKGMIWSDSHIES